MATYLADQPNLDQTQGGFDIADTAADITANLDQLNDPNIDAIIVSDNGQVGASVQQLTSDATAIGKLSNQNGSSYQLAVTDTAADITAALNSLDRSNIGSITISDNNAVGASVAELTSDATAIGKLANSSGTPYQLAISDTAANVQADLASLEADVAHIASITLTNGTVVVSVSAFTADQGALNKIVGGFAVSDTAPNIVAGLSTLNADFDVASITMTSGSATLSGGVGVSAASFSEIGSGTSLTIGEALTYAGAFSEAAGDTLALTGGALVLTGANDAFSGGTVDGSKFLYTEGTTAVSGLTIGGTVEWENTSAVDESGGNVTLGDNISTDEAILFNTAKATYDILDNSGIELGASTASYITNAGLFEKTGGAGTSVIAPSFSETATGTVTVASGTLSFSGPVNSFAGAITGAGTLQLAGGSDSIKSGAAISVANLSISGSGASVTPGRGPDLRRRVQRGRGRYARADRRGARADGRQ